MQSSVLMFHVGRSGSRVVGKLLDQHEHIDWQGEALKRPRVEAFAAELADPESYDTFAHLGSLAASRSADWLGVEAKFFHLRQRGIELAEFLDRVEEMGCHHFVALRRKNLLRKVVSSLVAKETRRYHRDRAAEAQLTQLTIDPAKVEIDAESKPLVAYLDDYSARFSELEERLAGRQFLDLTYEDHVSADPRDAAGKVCEFIGLEPAEFDVPFGKTNPFPLSQIVTNLDQVAECLAPTPYAWMASDGS